MASELQRAQRPGSQMVRETCTLWLHDWTPPWKEPPECRCTVQKPPASCSTRSGSWDLHSGQQWPSIASKLNSCRVQSKQEADLNLRQILLWKWNRAAQLVQQKVQGTSKATKPVGAVEPVTVGERHALQPVAGWRWLWHLITARAPLVSSCPGYQFKRIVLDIMGPMPTTHCSNKYILIVRNYFTKWKEEFVIPNLEASSREAVGKSHFQVWSARKDPLRPGTKLWSPAAPGNMCAVQYGQEQNLSIQARKWWNGWMNEPYLARHVG